MIIEAEVGQARLFPIKEVSSMGISRKSEDQRYDHGEQAARVAISYHRVGLGRWTKLMKAMLWTGSLPGKSSRPTLLVTGGWLLEAGDSTQASVTPFPGTRIVRSSIPQVPELVANEVFHVD
jgi:hypothetical protein